MKIIYFFKFSKSHSPKSQSVVKQKQSPVPASKLAKRRHAPHQAFPDMICELSTRWRHAMPRLYCDDEDDLP